MNYWNLRNTEDNEELHLELDRYHMDVHTHAYVYRYGKVYLKSFIGDTKEEVPTVLLFGTELKELCEIVEDYR